MALERRRGFKPDHKSFGAFLLSEQAREPAVEAAEDIAEIARAIAPRSSGPGPHMADQYKVNRKSAPVLVRGNLRVGAEVYNSDEAAAPVEFGGKRNKARRPLARAGAQIGELRGGKTDDE